MLPKVLSIIGAALLTSLVAYLLGRVTLARLPGVVRSATTLELRTFSLAVGAVVLSLVTFLICALGWLYDAVLVAAIGTALILWYFYGRVQASSPEFKMAGATNGWMILTWTVSLQFGVYYLFNALAPEHEHDALGYHLGQIARFRREHGFTLITSNLHAFMPKGAEMLYLFAYSFGRESASKLIHLGLLLLTCVGVVLLGRRLGAWRAGLVGALFFACTPVVGRDATSVYVDVALACFHWFTFHSLVLWWKTREDHWLAVAGLVAGFCFAIKYTGGLVVVAAVVAAVVLRRAEPQRAFRGALAVGCFAAISVIPWVAKVYVDTGSPTAPMFTRLFPNPYVTPVWEDSFKDFVKYYRYPDEDRSWKTSPTQIARELTVEGQLTQGFFGPAYLLAPFALLAFRRRIAWVIWAAAIVSALPWWMNATARFLIPSAVFVALALGFAVETMRGRARFIVACALVGTHAFSAWPPVRTVLLPNASFSLWELPIRAALRLDPEWQYLARRVPGYSVVRRLETRTPPGAKVFTFDHLPEYHFHGELLHPIMSTEAREIAEELLKVVEQNLRPTRKYEFRWPKRDLSGIRIELKNAYDNIWRIAEIRFLSGENAVAADEWEAHANTYPWTVERVIDSDIHSIWRSWRNRTPGDWLELRRENAVALDGMELRVPLGMHRFEPEIRAADSDGDWARLGATKHDSQNYEVDIQTLKDKAAQTLREREISHVVVNIGGDAHSRLLGPHIEEDPESWGLREVLREGRYRVYEVVEAK